MPDESTIRTVRPPAEDSTRIRTASGTAAAAAQPEGGDATVVSSRPAPPAAADPTQISRSGPPGGPSRSGWTPFDAPAEVGRKESTLELGEVLGNTYKIDGFIGRGGMGAVYRAKHLILDSEHAVKVIVPELASDPQIVAMIKAEAKALRKVRHEAVVEYQGLFLDEHHRRYLVMEYVDGPSLATLLKDRALAPEEVRILRDRLALGLAAAHDREVYHRDISPDNVILPGGLIENAKIIDFGIAKNVDPGEQQEEEDFAGKYSYVSPEQAGMYGGKVDGRSDMYSLGLVLAAAAMGHGRKIDMGNSPETVRAKRQGVPDLSAIPEELREELGAMLQPKPDDRPASLRAIVPSEQQQVITIHQKATRGILIGAGAVVGLIALAALLLFVFPGVLRPILADDPAQVQAQVHEVIGPLRCGAVDVDVGQDRFFRNEVRLSGVVPTQDDYRRIDTDVAKLRRVAKFTNDIQVIEWPFCEAVVTASRSASPLSAEAGPRLSVDRPDFVFHDGESIVFNVSAGQSDGFLYVDLIDHDGNVIHMMPTPKKPENAVEAGAVVTIGAVRGQQKPGEPVYVVGPPFGRNLLMVTQSAKPLFDKPRKQVDVAADYFDTLRAAIDAHAKDGVGKPLIIYQFMDTAAKE
jgi:serine/threonine-protein kinase